MPHVDRVGLDGDATLAFQVHGIEHLFAHLAMTERGGQLQHAVGQRGFAVVDVGDDAEVAGARLDGGVGLGHGESLAASCSARAEAGEAGGEFGEFAAGEEPGDAQVGDDGGR